jgi:O-antigen ligase
MKNFLGVSMLTVLLLCLVSATVAFGATTPDYAAPAFGFAVLLACLWALRLLVSRQTSFIRSPMHVPVVAFSVYALARYFTSPVEYDARQEMLQIGLCVFVYFLCACNFYRHRDRLVILTALMVLAALESSYGLWQIATKSDVVFHLQRQGTGERASGTFISPNHLAGFLEIVLALILAHIAVYRSSHDSVVEAVVHKSLEGYVALVVIVGLIATGSRGAWFASGVSIVVLGLWVWGRRRVTWRGTAWAAGILAVLALAAWSAPSVRRRLAEAAQERVATVVVTKPTDMPIMLKYSGVESRALLWRPTLAIVGDHPFIGTGPGSWMWVHLRYRDPRLQIRPEFAHNDILQLASDYGLIGFGLMTAIVAFFFWHAVALARSTHSSEHRAFGMGCTIAGLAVLIHSWVDFNMHIPANSLLVAVLMGLVVAAKNGQGPAERRMLRRGPRIALGVTLLVVAALGGWIAGHAALARRHASLGNDAKEILAWDTALEHYRRAAALDPSFPEPHVKIGDVYRTQAMWRTGEAHRADRARLVADSVLSYQRALQLNPYDSDALLRLAAAHETGQQHDRALEAYRKALDVDPNNAFVHLRLGLFLRRIGDDAQAEGAFEKALQLGCADQTARLNLDEIRKAKIAKP